MLTCITCAKQVEEKREDATPNTKQSAKSLTAQIKDMALRFSGAYRQCKPCTGSGSSYKKGQRPCPEFDAISEEVPYPFFQAGSSSSTPAWDYPSSGPRPAIRPPEARFVGPRRGDCHPPDYNGGKPPCDAVSGGEDDNDSEEWMAQVEPGVHITFVSLPNGGNDLKRIRFSRDIFNKWQAQRWWGENYDRIMELYNVQRFNRQALHTPGRSEDERDSSVSRKESPATAACSNRDWAARSMYHGGGGGHSVEASRTTASSREEASVSYSNTSEAENEWVEQDEVGVYITIRQLADGTRELRRVRFSRERFGEVYAKAWWEENRDRIQAQYL